jgi:hypothetical protein
MLTVTNLSGFGGGGRIAPVLLDAHTATGNTTITMTLPANNAGDSLIAFISCATSHSVTDVPAGWEQAYHNSTNYLCAVYTKISTGDTANVTWMVDGTGNLFGIVASFSNLGTDVAGTGTKSETSTAPSIIATQEGVLFGVYFIMTTRTVSADPSGMTQVEVSAGNQTLAVEYRVSPNGTTGDKTITWDSETGNRYGVLIQIS